MIAEDEPDSGGSLVAVLGLTGPRQSDGVQILLGKSARVHPSPPPALLHTHEVIGSRPIAPTNLRSLALPSSASFGWQAMKVVRRSCEAAKADFRSHLTHCITVTSGYQY